MELTGIAAFYFICAAVGFLLALVIAIFGEIGAHGGLDIGGHDIAVDHGGVDVGEHDLDIGGHDVDMSHDAAHGPSASFLNTLTLLTFVTTFGIAGLFSVWMLRLPALLSLVFALPMGVAGAVAEFVVYVKVFIKAQASSEATMSETLGCEAEVITTIPAERFGEIAYVIKGTRYTSPAMSADGVELSRGTRVQIVNTKSGALVVRQV